MQLCDAELAEAFQRFKALADNRRAVTLYDVFDEGAEHVREAGQWRRPGGTGSSTSTQRTPAAAGLE